MNHQPQITKQSQYTTVAHQSIIMKMDLIKTFVRNLPCSGTSLPFA